MSCLFQYTKMEKLERIRIAFVEWVRQLENEDLYYELLSLKPVMMVCCL